MIRTKWALLAAVGAVAFVPASATGEDSHDKATGGGQLVLTSTNPGKGAFDTLAFNAHRESGASDSSGAAYGQVQVNRRTGTNDIKFHGVVDCLIVMGQRAYISGNDKKTGTYFELFVEDNGEGNSSAADQGMVWYGSEESRNDMPENQTPGQFVGPNEDVYCGIEEDPDDEVSLARGNYQVHDANPAPSSSSSASRLSLAGLR